MPVFTFVTDLVGLCRPLREINRTEDHLDTSMAPWWVLRKTKF